jgi:hypothetical protein
MAAPRSGDSNPRSFSPAPASALERSSRRTKTQRSAQSKAGESKAAQSKAGEPPEPEVGAAPNPQPRAFRPQRPLWLSLLLWTQRGSSGVTLILGAAILVTYGWTVYIQQQWGREFDRLESMKKQERQLVSTNEVLKNQMAEQAEKPTAGLLLPDPSNAIFLTPAPQRPDVKASPTRPAELDSTRPLGY